MPILIYDLDRTLDVGSFVSKKDGAELFAKQQGLLALEKKLLSFKQNLKLKKEGKFAPADYKRGLSENSLIAEANLLYEKVSLQQKNVAAEKLKYFEPGTEIQPLSGDYYVIVDERDNFEKTKEKHLSNLLKILLQMYIFEAKGIGQYIATHNLSEVNEPGFVYNLLDQLTKDLLGVENITKNPIKKENIFDFVTNPAHRESDLQSETFNWIKEYGKNIHIVMAVIAEIEKEEGKLSDNNEKFTKAFAFIEASIEARNENSLFKKINSKLKNVYFFDDSRSNIERAKELGVNTYLVNNSDDTRTLTVYLSRVSEKIEALQQLENLTLLSPTKSHSSVFSPISPTSPRNNEGIRNRADLCGPPLFVEKLLSTNHYNYNF